MADVTADSRGQLFLVAALVIATVFVTLALLLNGVIYTENLSTRDTGAETAGAVTASIEVERSVGGLIDAENHEHYEDGDAVETAVEEGVVEIDERIATQHARRGVSSSASSTGVVRGSLIVQNESETFTGQDGTAENFTLAESVESARQYVVEVDTEELASPSNASEDAFYVTQDGSDERRIYLFADGGDLNVSVSDDGGETLRRVCPAVDATGNVTVDLTRGTVEGQHCSERPWATDVGGSYDLTYTNGEAIAGTYHVTVDREPSELSLDTLSELIAVGSDEQPFVVDAVYAVEVDFQYRTTHVTYETTVRVAPGEPRA